MKKAILFFLLIACVVESYASHGNKMFMKRPMASWTNFPAGMKDVEIEVTPLGIYARVDLTFTVGPSSNPSPTDSQEAVIFFDLPEGSYVHDSWLWLNPTTIISAELMERRKASEVYANIVQRRRDPSLLMNVLSQEYQLNIYPVSSGYWRKVKITYSTPVLWQDGRANVPLPLDLLLAAQAPPSFSLKVNTNGVFYNPRFAERAFGSWLTGQSGTSQQLSIPAQGYAGSDLTLSYEQYHIVDARLSTFPSGPDEGVYELIVPPATTPAPRYFNFVVDHTSYKEIYSLTELRRMMHQMLSTTLRPVDHFNIYYCSNPGTVASLFSGWRPADSAGIAGIGPAFASAYSMSDGAFSSLYTSALQFTATGPTSAETIVLNGNCLSMSSTTSTMVLAKLKAMPGLLNRKIRIINYHYSSAPGQVSVPFNAANFNSLLADIAKAGNGTYTACAGFYNDAYTQSTMYDFNMRDALRQSVAAGLQRTAIYNVAMPLNGFTHSEHSIATGRHYSPSMFYTESGKYYGQFNAPDSIRIDYSGATGLLKSVSQVAAVSGGDDGFRKTWNYYNNKALASYGSMYKQEIIDSSIANRVLSDFTAFLALETGDTIKASVGQNVSGYYPISVPGGQKSGTLIAYPNPFHNMLTIECTEAIEEVRVYNLNGSLVLAKKFQGNTHQWIWDGKDNNGSSLPAGIYLIRVSGNGQSTAIRVNKLDE